MPEVAELREEFQKSIAICAYACLLIAPVCIPLFTVLFLTEASLPPEAKEQAQKIGAMISAMYRVVPFTLIPAIVCGVLAYRLKKAGGELNLDHAKYIAISIGLLIPSFFIPVLVLWPVKRAFHGIIRAYFSGSACIPPPGGSRSSGLRCSLPSSGPPFLPCKGRFVGYFCKAL